MIMDMKGITKKFSLLVAAYGISLSATAQTPEDLSWSVTDTQNVQNAVWTEDEISEFLGRAVSLDDKPSVGEAVFKDLLGDGKIELIATIDHSGRNFFNTIIIVRRKGGSFSSQEIPALNLSNLEKHLTDLNGDGRQEILAPRPLTPYLQGTFPRAKWIAIYGWTDSLYADQSKSFAEYYKNIVLPELETALTTARQVNAPIPLALAQAEYDKALRLSGGDVESGLAFAQSLAERSDPRLRIWAAAILADIGTPFSIMALDLLTQDQDPEVSRYAKDLLNKSKQARCDSTSIKVLDIVNLDSRKPVRVVVQLSPVRGSERKLLDISSVKFGAIGAEDSLINCNNSSEGVTCLFRPEHTGLRVGDGVATLRAEGKDGSCIVGQSSINVI